MPRLAQLLSADRLLELRGEDKGAVLAELVGVVAGLPGQPGRKVLMRAILDREELRPTGIGEGIAIPHCKDPRIKEFGLAVGRTAAPIEFGAADWQPVRVLALIAAPTDRQAEYLRLLSTVTRFLKNERDRILEVEDLRSLVDTLKGY